MAALFGHCALRARAPGPLTFRFEGRLEVHERVLIDINLADVQDRLRLHIDLFLHVMVHANRLLQTAVDDVSK